MYPNIPQTCTVCRCDEAVILSVCPARTHPNIVSNATGEWEGPDCQPLKTTPTYVSFQQ